MVRRMEGLETGMKINLLKYTFCNLEGIESITLNAKFVLILTPTVKQYDKTFN